MRRLAFAVLTAGLAAGLLLLAWRVLTAHGWSGWEIALMACYALNVPGSRWRARRASGMDAPYREPGAFAAQLALGGERQAGA